MAEMQTLNCIFICLAVISLTIYVTYMTSLEKMTEFRLRGIFHRDVTSPHERDPHIGLFQYTMSNHSGKMFDVTLPLKIPNYFINLDNYEMTNFTFVTAADPEHFNETRDAIGGFQQVFPDHSIVYYDLGLSTKEAEEVKSWCNIKYRRLDYDRYPENVKHPVSYSFKSVIIYEMLHELEAIFWIDASIRPRVTNLSRWTEVFDVARTSGVVQFDHTGHNIYHCTHPAMFSYLPADPESTKNTEMLGAGAILIYRTEKVYWEIVHWHYLCGLTPDCLTPPGHISNCDKVTPNVTFCHRYDQSSLDILVTNSLSHNRTLYTAPENFILVQRYVTSNFPLKKCNTDNMSA